MTDSIEITVNTVETGTLITSGTDSARGTLKFDVPLTEGQTTAVTINTTALDPIAGTTGPHNTDTYTLNITRPVPTDTEKDVMDMLASLSEHYENTGDDWAAMSMAALGRANDVAGVTIVNNARNNYANNTGIDRSIIALTSLGVDATDVYSGDEAVYLNFIEKLAATPAGLYAAGGLYSLIALDSGDYVSEKRETYIAYILEQFNPTENRWTWGDADWDVDLNAEVVTALTPYYYRPEVKTAVDAAIAFLSEQQRTAGHYGDSNNTAMVIIALAAMGIDPHEDPRFTKGGNSVIDGLLEFRTTNDRFGWQNNTTESILSTQQGFRALVAYSGFLNEGAYNIYHFGPQTGDGTELTGEEDPSKIPPDPNPPRNVTVRVVDLVGGTTMIPETEVNVRGSHFDALKAALTANGIPDNNIVGTGWIFSIMGIGSGGWMSAINGFLGGTTPDEINVEENDNLVMYNIDWDEDTYITRFNTRRANITSEQSLTLTLTGIETMVSMGGSTSYNPISDATIFAVDATGNPTGASLGTTNASGQATLTFPTAGTYTVTAIKEGTANKWQIVPPLCTVTVTPADIVIPGDDVIVNFTLRGINPNTPLADQTWLNNIPVTVSRGSTIETVIRTALLGTGYTADIQSGYLRAVTTPDGFVLAEFHSPWPQSGWLFRINNELPIASIGDVTVIGGETVLLYFTRNYTEDPDAGAFVPPQTTPPTTPGGGAGGAGSEPEVSVTTDVEAEVTDGIAVVEVETVVITNLISEARDEGATNIAISVTNTEEVERVEVNLTVGSVQEIANGDMSLTVSSDVATITIDTETLAGLTAGANVGETVTLIVEMVDNASELNTRQQTIVGDNPVISLMITVGDYMVRDFVGVVTVTMPFTPPASVAAADYDLLTVYYIDDAGNIRELVGARYDARTGTITFTTTHFSMFFVSEWRSPFNDISRNNWFYRNVRFVQANGLMTGTSPTVFSPQSNLTRAMIVTILWRLEGEPTVSGPNPFSDVASGRYYTQAVIWAAANGIVEGHDGRFNPGGALTREQLATILYRYAEHKRLRTSGDEYVSSFADEGSVSEWAQEAMKWANARGLISGRTATTLAPRGTATRAEVAALLQRFIENIVSN
jgi:hypothetical protein